MIVVYGAAGEAKLRLDACHDAGGLGRRFGTAHPAGADPGRAPDRGVRAAADPERQFGLDGQGVDAGAAQVEIDAVVVDGLTLPEALNDIEGFVRPFAATLGVDGECIPFRRLGAADPESGQQAAAG
jgi:hypothetical protein